MSKTKAADSATRAAREVRVVFSRLRRRLKEHYDTRELTPSQTSALSRLDKDAPPSQTAWLVSALYLATSIGQPVAGRLVDIYRPRRVFLAGTSLAGVAGVIGVVAPNLGVLIIARVLLGFGTCAGYPAAMYLIR